MSRIEQGPMVAKASRARGFTRHIVSRALPGKNSDEPAVKLAIAAATKKMVKTVKPIGRRSEMGGRSSALD